MITAPAHRRRPFLLALGLATALGALYLVLDPQAPDLPAQLARASAAGRGAGLWWAGWYGGINTSTYSLVSAHLMSSLGVGAVGVLATVVVCLCGADLVRTAARPRAGAVAVSLAACANLYSGRLTFAEGMAVALVSFCCLRRGWWTGAVVAALLSGLFSPLAALNAAIVLAALWVHRPAERLRLTGLAAAALLPVAAVSVVFGQPSYMPISWDVLLLALLACGGVVVCPVPRVIRTTALLAALVALGSFVVPSPVGSNAARLPMLLAGPLVIATATFSATTVRRVASRLVVLGLLTWPVVSFWSDMAIAAQPSSRAAYYAPLLQQLPALGTSTQRVEVLDPLTHGAAFYAAQQVPLARGWERQIDAADNALFYDGTLTASSYRAWLVQHGVGYVAVPTAELDYGSIPESTLVTGGLPYLTPLWSNADWRLYRVAVAAPVATGVLRTAALTDTGVVLRAGRAGSGTLHVPYSRLLGVRGLDGAADGCLTRDPDGESVVTVPSAGTYEVSAALAGLARSCPASR